MPSRRDYVFREPTIDERLRQVAGQSLSAWRTGPEATTPGEIAARDALRARYLTPEILPMAEYQARLQNQALGASVPAMRTIPIVLSPTEADYDDAIQFTRWVHRVRHLSNLVSLQVSGDLADVRLERKLRFDFAKLKARGQLRSIYGSKYLESMSPDTHNSASAADAATGLSRSTAIDLSTSTPSSGKRSGSRLDPVSVARKRPRRTGNPALVEPRTPTSSRNQGNPSTLPDTGIDPDDDVAEELVPRGTVGSHARRATPESADVAANAHADLAHEVNRLHETLS